MKPELRDTPHDDGLYVVYTDDPHVRNWAKRQFATWSSGRWFHPMSDQRFRAHIYGCVGPLPALELTEE